jgi:hypothetical protein
MFNTPFICILILHTKFSALQETNTEIYILVFSCCKCRPKCKLSALGYNAAHTRNTELFLLIKFGFYDNKSM